MWLKGHKKTESEITVIVYKIQGQQKENTALKQGEQISAKRAETMTL